MMTLLVAVCVMVSVGAPGVRLGVIVDGPVTLQPSSAANTQFLTELIAWAKRAGFVFLKFSHFDADLVRLIESLPNVEAVNAFPFYGSQKERLLVDLQKDEEAMLASFQPVARYEIRAACRAGLVRLWRRDVLENSLGNVTGQC